MSYNKMNNPEDEGLMYGSQVQMDKMYQHNSETFLHKYRWWIVLIIVLLLAWYLYAKRAELGLDKMVSKVTNPILGEGSLSYPESSAVSNNGIPTETRNLFRL